VDSDTEEGKWSDLDDDDTASETSPLPKKTQTQKAKQTSNTAVLPQREKQAPKRQWKKMELNTPASGSKSSENGTKLTYDAKLSADLPYVEYEIDPPSDEDVARIDRRRRREEKFEELMKQLENKKRWQSQLGKWMKEEDLSYENKLSMAENVRKLVHKIIE
jgi:hypothetical protein